MRKAYRERLLKEAEGEAKRFTSVYEAYKTAPEVTRRRMYLETMGNVFGSAQKVIVDQNGESSQGVVPYLPLPEIQKRVRSGADSSSTSSQPANSPAATQPAQR